jgi:hypothetical protein
VPEAPLRIRPSTTDLTIIRADARERDWFACYSVGAHAVSRAPLNMSLGLRCGSPDPHRCDLGVHGDKLNAEGLDLPSDYRPFIPGRMGRATVERRPFAACHDRAVVCRSDRSGHVCRVLLRRLVVSYIWATPLAA